MNVAIEERRSKWLLSSKDGEYTKLAVIEKQPGFVLAGLTSGGLLHLIDFHGDRPFIRKRCKREEFEWMEEQCCVRLASQGGGADVVSFAVKDWDIRVNVADSTVEKKGMKFVVPSDSVVVGKDFIATPDGRVMLVWWPGLCVKELAERGLQQGRAVAVVENGRMLVRSGDVGKMSVLHCIPMLRGHLIGMQSYLGMDASIIRTSFTLVSACGHAAIVGGTGNLVVGKGAVVKGRWIDVLSLGAKSWCAVRNVDENRSVMLLDGLKSIQLPFACSWVARHSVDCVSVGVAGDAGVRLVRLSEENDVFEEIVPAAPNSWLPFAYMDPFSLSLMRGDGQGVWWGDNSELDWWPLYCSSNECCVLVLRCPLRLARHPLPSCQLQSAPLSLFGRSLQLLLHKAILELGDSKSNCALQLGALLRGCSPALSLFCIVRVARRLDPEPYWSLLLPDAEQKFELALSLSPSLASLMLPLVPHLNVRLCAMQLSLSLDAEVADTLRFSADSSEQLSRAMQEPLLLHHCRDLLCHARLVPLLRFCQRMDCWTLLPELSVSGQDSLDMWVVVGQLQEQLGLANPVVIQGRLHLPMLAEARNLLHALAAAEPHIVWKLVAGTLLLQPQFVLQLLLSLEQEDAVRVTYLNGAPLVWMPVVEMVKKALDPGLVKG